MVHTVLKMKEPHMKLLKSLLNVFISLGYEFGIKKNNEPDAIGIRYNNFRKIICYKLGNKKLNKVINCFCYKRCI